MFHNKTFAVVPIGNRDGENESVGKERVGTIGAIKRHEEVGGGGVYDLTNLSGEDTPLIFVYILASFMEILGKGGKVGVVDFLARKASGSRTIVKLLGEQPRCFIGNRAIYGAEDARQPPPSFLLILAARR